MKDDDKALTKARASRYGFLYFAAAKFLGFFSCML